jgi:hypothetical protein
VFVDGVGMMVTGELDGRWEIRYSAHLRPNQLSSRAIRESGVGHTYRRVARRRHQRMIGAGLSFAGHEQLLQHAVGGGGVAWVGLTHAWVGLTHAWVGLTHAWVGLTHAWVGLTHAWVGLTHTWVGLTHAWVGLTHTWVGLTHAWVGLTHTWVGLTHAWVG